MDKDVPTASSAQKQTLSGLVEEIDVMPWGKAARDEKESYGDVLNAGHSAED